ncbi:hypothetical protein BC827DRAFT_225714 [Russula dissimulans]|nr:hypothetical protein BC827DRAFT_225714 [Russula dissimulans]
MLCRQDTGTASFCAVHSGRHIEVSVSSGHVFLTNTLMQPAQQCQMTACAGTCTFTHSFHCLPSKNHSILATSFRAPGTVFVAIACSLASRITPTPTSTCTGTRPAGAHSWSAIYGTSCDVAWPLHVEYSLILRLTSVRVIVLKQTRRAFASSRGDLRPERKEETV